MVIKNRGDIYALNSGEQQMLSKIIYFSGVLLWLTMIVSSCIGKKGCWKKKRGRDSSV